MRRKDLYLWRYEFSVDEANQIFIAEDRGELRERREGELKVNNFKKYMLICSQILHLICLQTLRSQCSLGYSAIKIFYASATHLLKNQNALGIPYIEQLSYSGPNGAKTYQPRVSEAQPWGVEQRNEP